MARYHTGIVKLGVAITSEPHLCNTFSMDAVEKVRAQPASRRSA
jgi:hypothetical protein